MFNSKKWFLIYFCAVIIEELCPVPSVYGQYPYPGVFYPPTPFISSSIFAPPYPFYSQASPYFGSQCYGSLPPLPPPPAQQSSSPVRGRVNMKPRIVKPFRVSGTSGPLILPNRVDSNSPPIIIQTRSSRMPPERPTLLSPFTNLIHSFLKNLAPRSCDCDNDFR